MEENIGTMSADTVLAESAIAQNGRQEEQNLADEIEQLRAVLAESWNTARKTKAEVKDVKDRLKGRLQEVKQFRTFASASARLRKKLTSPGLAYDYLRWYVGSFGLPHEAQDNGILVLDPTFTAAGQSSDSAGSPAAGQEATVACAGGDVA